MGNSKLTSNKSHNISILISWGLCAHCPPFLPVKGNQMDHKRVPYWKWQSPHYYQTF